MICFSVERNGRWMLQGKVHSPRRKIGERRKFVNGPSRGRSEANVRNQISIRNQRQRVLTPPGKKPLVIPRIELTLVGTLVCVAPVLDRDVTLDEISQPRSVP